MRPRESIRLGHWAMELSHWRPCEKPGHTAKPKLRKRPRPWSLSRTPGTPSSDSFPQDVYTDGFPKAMVDITCLALREQPVRGGTLWKENSYERQTAKAD